MSEFQSPQIAVKLKQIMLISNYSSYSNLKSMLFHCIFISCALSRE